MSQRCQEATCAEILPNFHTGEPDGLLDRNSGAKYLISARVQVFLNRPQRQV
jgi:hypothetical protein